jgi:hypothetical protein
MIKKSLTGIDDRSVGVAVCCGLDLVSVGGIQCSTRPSSPPACLLALRHPTPGRNKQQTNKSFTARLLQQASLRRPRAGGGGGASRGFDLLRPAQLPPLTSLLPPASTPCHPQSRPISKANTGTPLHKGGVTTDQCSKLHIDGSKAGWQTG